MNADPSHRNVATHDPSRRDILKRAATTAGVLSSATVAPTVWAAPRQPDRVLLQRGLIVDGTGREPFEGDVLLEGDRIAQVSPERIRFDGHALDCRGKAVAPGFIDAHSHMDWILAMPDKPDLKSPFTGQGCTTFVAGNCGAAAAGFRKGSRLKRYDRPNIFPDFEITWDSMAEYTDHIRKVGPSHNMMMFVGHGLTRASMRGNDPSPLKPVEMKELLALLEQGMDEGACGVSLGLQYDPGIFATPDELEAVAKLVASKDKILSVHARAYSAIAPEYGLKPFGTPANIQALDEMIDLAKRTGVRVQYSHLIFAGRMSHRSCGMALDRIDKARAAGIDIWFDTYPYHCGNTGLTVLLPKWFRENVPANYDDPAALQRLRAEIAAMSNLVGLGYEDVQITHADSEELRQYNGMFVADIATKLGKTPFETALLFMKTGGAWVLLHTYSNLDIIEALMRHDAALFMTDAVPAPWLRNPAAYGSFPLFLQYARDRKLLSLASAVRKMTGLTAERFRMRDRGLLDKGLAADVTVFDPKTVKDNTTLKDFNRAPTGIEAVFLNGRRALTGGKVDAGAKVGRFQPA